MALHFSAQEFEKRIARTVTAMSARGLDGLLMFRPESQYYITGYDTFGYVFFQCVFLGADGTTFLLTRAPDLRQAQQTSTIGDIHVWVDGPDADPTLQLRDLLQAKGMAGKHLGVEYEAYGLTARNGKRVDAALDGFCTLSEASDLVSRERVVKSEEELVYVRRAAGLADDALDAALALAHPGAFEGDILAAMQGAVFRGDGDYPGNPFIIGSGPAALLCRYYAGRRTLSDEDQITLEWAGVYRHYHAAMMRTIPIGRAADRHVELHRVTTDAMAACAETLRPGETLGAVFDAYAAVCDRAGMTAHRMNATGYSLGTTFPPNWMDWPMLYHGNREEIRPGMVFFMHMILMDSDSGYAMCPGQTYEVTDHGSKSLSRHDLALTIG